MSRRYRNGEGTGSSPAATDLRAHFAPELVEALERLVDERVAAALADRPTGSDPVWLSLSEAASYLRVSPRTVARLRERGRVRVSYVGRRVLVNRADLDARAD